MSRRQAFVDTWRRAVLAIRNDTEQARAQHGLAALGRQRARLLATTSVIAAAVAGLAPLV